MRDRAVVRGVRTLFEVGTATGLTDGQLLERYCGSHGGSPSRGDDSAEAAFRALVERHGPMVLRACRGVLHDVHAAEDAFQATFLILARKAGSIRRMDSVASWLFGVARRVAGRAAMQRQRRAARERPGVEMDEPAGWSSPDRPFESAGEVQEEVDRLPERYRAPVVLCYLEGLTQEEAAIRLRLPASTVRVRLMRARSRLRDRLTRRGLTPGALAGLATGRADALIPAPLVDEIVKAAIRVAAGRAAGASAPVAALVEGVIRAMFLARLKTTAALLAALTCASLGMIATLAGPSPPRQEPPAAKVPEAAEKPKAPPQERNPEVTVESVRRSRWGRTTSQPATVKAFDSADLYARTPGYLKSVLVDIGSRVKKDEILAELYDPGLSAAVEKARAEVERAQARVKRAKAAIEVAWAAANAESLKARVAASLAEKRTVSTQEVELARAAEAEAKARLDMARADLVEADSEVRISRAGLDSTHAIAEATKIRSPLDGVVTRRGYHVGELVGSPNAGKVGPLFTVVRTGIVRVEVQVPDRDSSSVDPGDPARIRLDALGPRTVYQGRVARTAYELNPQFRTLLVEIDLPNADGRLRPGQHGSAEIELEARENVITIPNSAMVNWNGVGSGACFRVADGRAARTRIEVGIVDRTRVEILEGLKEGDVVITQPGGRVSDGKPVTIRPE